MSYLSNRLQTLAQWSLGIEFYCYDFIRNFQLLFRIYSGFSGSLCMDQCRFNDVHVGWICIVVWIESGWNAGSVSRLGLPINPLYARFDNKIAFCWCEYATAQLRKLLHKCSSTQVHVQVWECERTKVWSTCASVQLRKCANTQVVSAKIKINHYHEGHNKEVVQC